MKKPTKFLLMKKLKVKMRCLNLKYHRKTAATKEVPRLFKLDNLQANTLEVK